MYMQAYAYSLLAACLIGFHIFSIKYLQSVSDVVSNQTFYYIMVGSFLIWIISRVLIYLASSSLPITVIHIILNLSVIVTALISVLVLKNTVHWGKFFMGLLFVLGGVYIVENSID